MTARPPMSPFGDGVNVLVAHGEHSLASLVAAASGGTDWPIADRDTAWDGSEAAKDMAKWASSDGSGDKDKIDWGKYGSGFFWKDTSDGGADAIGDFKLGFVANDGGTMKAIPKGIFAVGGVLSGARGGADLGGDETAVKAKVAAWYRKLAAKFDDPSIKAPWLPDKESSAKSRILAAVDVLPGFQASEAATSLIVAIDAAVDELMEELGIGDDDGEDQMSAAAAVALRRAQLALAKAEMGPEPLASVHPPFTGRHSHPHSAFGQQGGDATHSHSHSHNGDATHVHAHGAMAGEPAQPLDPAKEVTDPAQLSAMVAAALERCGLTAATKPDGTVVGSPWHAYIAAEGVRTDDGRELLEGSCQWNDLPISLALQIEDEGGHWGAVVCGRIDTIERQVVGGVTMLYAEGVFGSDPNGQLAELLVSEQTQRFVSIDPRGDCECELVEIATTVTDGAMYGLEDGGDQIVDSWVRYSSLTIGSATIVRMPALQMAVIALADTPLPVSTVAIQNAPPSLAAAGGPLRAPKDWFNDPGFHVGDPRLVKQADGHYACPLTVTDDGQVYGHVAYWGATHNGFPGKKVNPPRSKTGYALFNRGVHVCADGTRIEGVGQVTMGCGHAATNLGWTEALAHYDGGYGAVQVADVRAGSDDFGPWIAGALRSDLTPEQVRQFQALSLSGDWRSYGGNLEMIAVLAVPVPGFAIVRQSVVASAAGVDNGEFVRTGYHGEEVWSLVAAGRVRPIDPLVRLATLERQYEALQARYDALAAELRPVALDRARSLL
ncbi:MAG TPA: hypothetical protein VMH24_00720 [Candidatus Sulfotelmatobacter sp.]|nr:hypothetical protein [Candidatus Sulfotelmatobacter sp.]